MRLSRRDFIQTAAAMGAALAWGGTARASRSKWREARTYYPEGVASGDPDPNSVILWTRRPFDGVDRQMLTVEVAEENTAKKILRLMDALEENDDVQDVYANFDIPERVLETVAG